jgi:ribosomal protein S21
MIEVQKKENESTAGLIRRFAQKLQQSGKLQAARSSQFKTRPKSELSKKKQALWRIQKKKETEYLRKLGKIE